MESLLFFDILSFNTSPTLPLFFFQTILLVLIFLLSIYYYIIFQIILWWSDSKDDYYIKEVDSNGTKGEVTYEIEEKDSGKIAEVSIKVCLKDKPSVCKKYTQEIKEKRKAGLLDLAMKN